jgi:hypothetical protein
VYARTLGSATFTFQVSGKLWRNSLIMQDRETGSWWSQVTGRAIDGKNRGAQLQKLESIETSWAQWFAGHPESSVLAKTEVVTASHYEKYFEDPERMGLFRAQWLTDVMPGKTLVYGAAVGPHAVAVTDGELDRGTVRTDLGGVPVVVARGADGGVRAFVARIDGHKLQPTPDDAEAMMIDATGSTWDATTGICVKGPQQGSILETVAVTPVYWFAWSGFYPNTEVIGSHQPAE